MASGFHNVRQVVVGQPQTKSSMKTLYQFRTEWSNAHGMSIPITISELISSGHPREKKRARAVLSLAKQEPTLSKYESVL